MKNVMIKPLALAVGITLSVAACGQHGGQGSSQAPAKAASVAVKPAPASTAPVFNVANLDPSISPCQDLNGFVNAKWVKAHPIPDDQTSTGSFRTLYENGLKKQRQLVEMAAKKADSAKPGSIEQKIGWMYHSAMDMAARDKAGVAPLKPYLASIDAITSRKQLQPWLDTSFANGKERVFSLFASADYKNAKQQIAFSAQDGLGLPTPDYYTSPKYKKQRQAYVDYLTELFKLSGDTPAQASQQAALTMKFETALAKHSMSRVELRKPQNQYRFVSLAQANKLTPHFNWNTFFAAQGVDVGKGFSLTQPDFFKQFDHMLAATPLNEWKAYFKAHALTGAAGALSQAFVDAHFKYAQTLTGQPKQPPQWKRGLSAVNGTMGQALGQLYVAKYFPPQAKARADKLVHNVLAALKGRIERADWMSEATKQKALDKWSKILPKIGYPKHWRSWDGLKVTPDNYYGNLQAAAKFNHAYDMAKIGKPSDRQEWEMNPQTVNAYYSSNDNTINFPAAILQPPFFYANGDDGVNYGGIGAIIGHESSHGFDDQGSQFDGDGNLSNWWTKADRKAYDAHAKLLVEQFDNYVPMKDHPDLHVNGKLTLGENIADLGGLNIAYDALQAALKNHPAEASRKIDGYTEDQRFFMAFARNYRGARREKLKMLYLNIDPHAPDNLRAIAAPSNMPAFAKAFQCKPGDKMVRPADKRVKIW